MEDQAAATAELDNDSLGVKLDADMLESRRAATKARELARELINAKAASNVALDAKQRAQQLAQQAADQEVQHELLAEKEKDEQLQQEQITQNMADLDQVDEKSDQELLDAMSEQQGVQAFEIEGSGTVTQGLVEEAHENKTVASSPQVGPSEVTFAHFVSKQMILWCICFRLELLRTKLLACSPASKQLPPSLKPMRHHKPMIARQMQIALPMARVILCLGMLRASFPAI